MPKINEHLHPMPWFIEERETSDTEWHSAGAAVFESEAQTKSAIEAMNEIYADKVAKGLEFRASYGPNPMAPSWTFRGGGMFQVPDDQDPPRI